MRVVERHLFNRNGFYYFRSSIPRTFQSVLGFKEIKIALGTQDLREARAQAGQLDYELTKAIRVFQQTLRQLSPLQSPEAAIDSLISQIGDLKGSVSQ